MTHVKPRGGQTGAPPTTPALYPLPPTPGSACRHSLDRHRLSTGIAERRQRLHELEIELVAACETAATGNAFHGVIVVDRGTWDRQMWNRYLAVAADLEGEYGPKMRRLLQEIHQLERLLKLPVSA